MKIIALLPMKGHSERVPNKNMRLFDGRPLYHCVADVLEACQYISSFVINTDSQAIAEDAVKHYSKVRIIVRPQELCGDFVPMNEIIEYDMAASDGEHFIQTHSTNPLLTTETLDRAAEEYFKVLGTFDSLFSVTRLQTRLYWASGEPVNHNPDELLRTQDLPPVFEENSNLYLFSKSSFLAAGNKRIGLKPKMFEINKMEAVDIDEEEDFKLAETLFRMRKQGVEL
ncbi:MAG: acylneuraminate cytidylyltransferase family protein [Desulfuromonadales bacterium]|nr:acylneuraminate cytidylyltransferase family protein [Desulfuromonadales bacterium]